MLKKIDARELMVGMFVDRLSGSWLDHPFWKKSFLLSDLRQLDAIRASGIRDVWIDTAKGLDLPSDDDDPSALETMIATMVFGPDREADVSEPEPDWEPDLVFDVAPGPCSFADELERAGRIVAEGRVAMQRLFEDVRLGRAVDAEHCLPLVHDITQSIDRNPGAIVSLARLKTSDDYTYLHSVAVCALMVALSRRLGLSAADTREAGVAGLVHDLGKAVMPRAILGKPGALTADEHAVMRRHPEAGHALLRESRGVGPIPLDVCLHHHEKVDGSGYPHGLRGTALSLAARMGAVCDVYDAITSNRPYKAGWDPAQSIQKMAQWSRDGHFDDLVLQAFIKSIGIYPVGSLVRLSSERLAVVVEQSPGNLLKPIVKVVFDAALRMACDPERIELGAPGCPERIVSRETAAAWGLDAIDDHWRLPASATA